MEKVSETVCPSQTSLPREVIRLDRTPLNENHPSSDRFFQLNRSDPLPNIAGDCGEVLARSSMR
jgi:hypothetical protein